MAIAGKESDNGVVEFQFYRHENRTKWQNFKNALYDKSTNQILGRTPKNWGQLLLFYAIFYAVLAALFAICMQGLFATLDEREPRWQMTHGLIGDNPGLGFRPISPKTEEGSLVWYNITNATTVDKWVKLADTFLAPYKANQTGKNYVPCNFDKPPQEGKVCMTTVESLKNCSPERKYGYNSSSPCIFLKLNKIFGWTPEFYTEPVEGMPEDLVAHLNSTKSEESKKQIWVTCNGVDDVDKENVKGFNYYPRGFAGYYYPYRNVENYLSPIIAVQLLNVTPDVIVSIECRAWAKNIVYRGGSLNRAGSITFEVQVDKAYNPPEQLYQSKYENGTINIETTTVTSTTSNSTALPA
ncbi:unnamed protein product [Phaedon cochleariae]|uniref:Sodium/potassium-transporting ATPase subunit beta-1 n=1 Tax=Phaedon cochleariae TaxID=80249 RepID=A0A9N9SKV2_PHACE|nr:unnamed protein product [Phaedon cochleariae]